MVALIWPGVHIISQQTDRHAGRSVVVETCHLGSLEKGFPSTLPGLVVRTESGGDRSPKSSCLSATAFGHQCSQCSTVDGSSPQLGHFGSTVVAT